jgi:hypothetical protein
MNYALANYGKVKVQIKIWIRFYKNIHAIKSILFKIVKSDKFFYFYLESTLVLDQNGSPIEIIGSNRIEFKLKINLI